MEKYFLYDEYRTWFNKKKKKRSSGKNAYRPYAECIYDQLFNDKDNKDIPPFEQDFTYYVPALMFSGLQQGDSKKRELAKELLACVYADVYLNHSSKQFTYFKSYCEFLASRASRKKKKEVQLDDNIIKKISDYLENRHVSVVEDRIAKYLKTIAGNKKSTFNELFNIRIYSWGRPNFPLDIIKKFFLDDNYMSDWVNKIRNCIDVVIDGSGNRIKLNTIKAFDFRKNEKKVIAIKNNRVSHIVFTPLADGGYDIMKVDKLEDMSIDHEYPLDAIVRNIVRKGSTELGKISDAYKNDPKFESTSSECLIKSVNKKTLKEEMEKIRIITDYYLMDRIENSRKSNNTDFQRFEEVDGDIWFIVADDVEDDNREKYMVYFSKSDKTKTKKLKKKSELECIFRTK